ncbi:MAG: GNAT family N-acetyltransferase [Alphaproteobacteria bacterium]|nr:GNAT family N-acetyltransferase [Alphaproteobacteria bacterium]
MPYLIDPLRWGARVVGFDPAHADEFERLLDLRIRVQRAHLERLNRFHPERARQRFAAAYDPGATRLITVDGSFAGMISIFDRDDVLEIGQFYLEPEFQSGGLGGTILAALLAATDTDGRILVLDVIRDSPANRFYNRFGFVETHQAPYDIYYRRAAPPATE